jgi:hypothetical protein
MPRWKALRAPRTLRARRFADAWKGAAGPVVREQPPGMTHRAEQLSRCAVILHRKQRIIVAFSAELCVHPAPASRRCAKSGPPPGGATFRRLRP